MINDIADNLTFARISVFADVKIFAKATSPIDSSKRQHALNTISDWARRNRWELNINKCKVPSLYRNNIPFTFRYRIENNTLEAVNSIIDLGVTFEKSFDVRLHVNGVTAKSHQ